MDELKTAVATEALPEAAKVEENPVKPETDDEKYLREYPLQAEELRRLRRGVLV